MCAPEAWSISNCEGSCRVHFDVTCTSRVLLERVVCKHRSLEKYIASKVLKVALISINMLDYLHDIIEAHVASTSTAASLT